MEDSCPATPLVLSGRNSKSPLQVGLMSPESDGIKSPSPGSPDSRCVICLGRLQNKSFTDSCLHQFCFQCLLQWSKVKPECPLCKQPFKSIIHNVRSNLDYDQYHVEHGEPRNVLTDLMHSYNFELIQFDPVDRRFRYRSTMTREYFRELAESFLAHTRRIPGDSYQINPLVPVDPAPASSAHRSNRVQSNSSHRRTRVRGTSDFRRNVYAQDLWVQDLADISGRYRECSPQFYRENPAQIHRIIPWLNREVNVLLNSCESQSQEAYVLSRIVHLLTHHPIRSREFREEVQTYFGDRTDHFIHELYTFARSVYDIAGFDENAVYGTNPNYATEVQEISSSSDNNDSDIEVIEPVKREGKPRHGFRKLLLKRAEDDASKADEPVAGPSGISSRRVSGSIDVCESDPEEIKILDYVKPEPIVVTLSSGEEAQAYSDLDISNGEYAKVIRSETRLRRSSSHEDEKRNSRNRSEKGKCKSNGFGLKGKQKYKYIKSRRRRSRSRSSCSSTTSISSGSSTSTSTSTSTRSSSSSSSSSRSSGSTSSTSSYGKRCRTNSSLYPRYSHRSSSKLKKKKSKKKLKKKISCKSSHKRHKSTSDVEKTEKRKRKRVKSCVVVPSWSCDSSPSSHKWAPARSPEEPNLHTSYWSIPFDDRPHKWWGSPERSKSKRRGNTGEERTKKRSREPSSFSDRIVDDSDQITSSGSKRSTSYDTLSLPSTSGLLSTSHSLPVHSNSQNFINSE